MSKVFILYRACIDTSEGGNLEKGVYLGEYSITNEYKPLTQEDQLNITINVHDDGNTLEIVSVCCKFSSTKLHIQSVHLGDKLLRD